MKHVLYVGPQGGGVVIYTDRDAGVSGPFVHATHDDPVELPDDIADELIERGEVTEVSAATGAPKRNATHDVWEAYRAAQGHDVTGLTKQQLIDLPDAPADVEA